MNPVVIGERIFWATPSSETSGPLLWSAPVDSLRACTSRPLPADRTISGLFAAKDRLIVKRDRDRDECISALDVVIVRQGSEIVALAR